MNNYTRDAVAFVFFFKFSARCSRSTTKAFRWNSRFVKFPCSASLADSIIKCVITLRNGNLLPHFSRAVALPFCSLRNAGTNFIVKWIFNTCSAADKTIQEYSRLETVENAKLDGQSITMFQGKLLRNLGLEFKNGEVIAVNYNGTNTLCSCKLSRFLARHGVTTKIQVASVTAKLFEESSKCKIFPFY